MTLCVYSLASPPDARITTTGISGERLRAIAVGRVAAIAGELTRLPSPNEATLRKYARVLHSLSDRLPAVIPVRFGTCFTDPEELATILRTRQDAFRRSLRAVRGRVQMTTRIVQSDNESYEEGGFSNSYVGTGSRRPVPQSGAEYLGMRAAEAARARGVPGFAPVRDAVRRWVRQERLEKQGRVVSVYHLVPRASAQAYRRALERSARDTGLRVIVSGPWPPYAFSSSL